MTQIPTLGWLVIAVSGWSGLSVLVDADGEACVFTDIGAVSRSGPRPGVDREGVLDDWYEGLLATFGKSVCL